jgi:hypothetical protein
LLLVRNPYRQVVEVPTSRNSLSVRNRINGCADILTMIESATDAELNMN